MLAQCHSLALLLLCVRRPSWAISFTSATAPPLTRADEAVCLTLSVNYGSELQDWSSLLGNIFA